MNDKDAKLMTMPGNNAWVEMQAGRRQSGAVMDWSASSSPELRGARGAGRRCGVSFFSRTLFRLHVQHTKSPRGLIGSQVAAAKLELGAAQNSSEVWRDHPQGTAGSRDLSASAGGG